MLVLPRDACEAMVGLSLLPFFGGVCTFMGLIIWAAGNLRTGSG